MALFISLIMISSVRDRMRLWFWGGERKVLATMKGDLIGDGSLISIIKIKERDALFVEIYSNHNVNTSNENQKPSSPLHFVQKIEIPNPIDGYVTFMGQASNLAMANLDSDPQLEILVPSFNLEFGASLDVIKYNPAMKVFEIMKSFELPENLIESLNKDPE